MAYRKFYKIIFPETFIFKVPSSMSMVRACKKIGHRAKFRANSKCFPQILFPVRAILRRTSHIIIMIIIIIIILFLL